MRLVIREILLLTMAYLSLVNTNKNSKGNTYNNNNNNKSPKTYANVSLKFYSTVVPGRASPNLIPSSENTPLNYCSFFNNRAPSPQVNLKNCTWYRENSCCLQSEIESTFSKVKPLIGSSDLCQQYLNNLMCYICAPNQFKFYGKERLTVCVEFCDKMYDACSQAILKGSKIKDIYSNGEEFCQSRRYNIGNKTVDKCFYYDVKPIVSSSALSLNKNSIYNFILSLLMVSVNLIFLR